MNIGGRVSYEEGSRDTGEHILSWTDSLVVLCNKKDLRRCFSLLKKCDCMGRPQQQRENEVRRNR